MLRILCQLQSGERLNVSELAGALNVCRRTVFRDLNMMRQAGLELRYDQRLDSYELVSQQGGVPTPELELDELTTLLAAVHLSVLRMAPHCQELLRQSITKLLAKSPHHVRHRATRVMRSCAVNVAEQVDDGGSMPFVHEVLTAISRRKVVRVTIVEIEVGCVLETRFAPYQMIAAANSWRVKGRSSLHRGVRTFDAAQLRQLEITDENYSIPRRYQSAI